MRAVWIAGATLLFAASFDAAAAADRAPLGRWIDRYEAMRCEPHQIVLASRTPLRFAVLGECAGVPRAQRQPSTRQLVAVDTATNTVVSAGLGYGHVRNSVYADANGSWRWLSLAGSTYPPRERLEIQELAPGQQQTRAIATEPLGGLEGRIAPGALRGDTCWLFNRAKFKDREMRELTGFELVSVENDGLRIRPAEGLRGVSFWHPLERAFVVQLSDTATPFALLGCDGSRRPLAEGDRLHLEAHGGREMRISAQGDWSFSRRSGASAFNSDSGDQVIVLHGLEVLTFGPFFEPQDRNCPDICETDTYGLTVADWSESGKFILVEGYENYVLRAEDLYVVRKWRTGSYPSRAMFLGESLVMDLTKSRGVTFYRW